VRMLVYNKHLLFNMRGMNIKVKAVQQCVCRYPVVQRTVQTNNSPQINHCCIKTFVMHKLTRFMWH